MSILAATMTVLLAILIFFVALLISAQAIQNAIVSYAVAAVAAFLSAAGLARGAVRIRNCRKGGRNVRTVRLCAGLSLLLSAGLAWAWFGAPVTYIPTPDSPSLRYWTLPTGSRIAYFRIADRVTHAEPVLLVHGGPGAPGTGGGVFAKRLAAAGFAVYDYQQVGAGRSSRLDPSEYTVARHVADLDAIREKLAATKIVLIGSSWGGELTAQYMAAHPDNVAKAVVASPGAISRFSFTEGSQTSGGETDQNNQLAAHTRFAATFFLAQMGGLRAVSTLMPDRRADGLYQQYVSSLNLGSGCAGVAKPETSGLTAAGYGLWANIATNASAAKAADPRPKLRGNATPLLVLRAQCDYLRWEVTREYLDTFPGATMQTIDGAGHTVLADKPAETSAAVIAFLSGKALPAKPYTDEQSPWGR